MLCYGSAQAEVSIGRRRRAHEIICSAHQNIPCTGVHIPQTRTSRLRPHTSVPHPPRPVCDCVCPSVPPSLSLPAPRSVRPSVPSVSVRPSVRRVCPSVRIATAVSTLTDSGKMKDTPPVLVFKGSSTFQAAGVRPSVFVPGSRHGCTSPCTLVDAVCTALNIIL